MGPQWDGSDDLILPPMGTIRSSFQKGNWRFFPRGRDGFGAMLDVFRQMGNAPMVYLPSYIGWSAREGSGVFDPVNERSIPFRFYPMKSDLTVNFQELQSVLSGVPQGAVFLVIHYFGRPDPNLKEITALARGKGMWVVEDAVHALFSSEHLRSCGVGGDVVLYSFHKMFNGKGGGAVKLNAPGILEYCRSLNFMEFVSPSWSKMLDYDIEGCSLSRLSKFHAYRGGVAGLSRHVRPFWRTLPEGTVPHSFPVWVSNKELRDRLYFGLKKQGYPVASLYHELIEPLKNSWNKSSLRLADHIFNLPISDQISNDSIAEICGQISRVVKNRVNA